MPRDATRTSWTSPRSADVGFEPSTVSTESLGQGGLVSLDLVTFEADGTRFSRDVVRHRGAVSVLAFDGSSVVVIRQWRAPLDQTILEIPGGTCDVAGEPLEETARRELEEEAGLQAGSLEPLCSFWNAPGWCDQLTVVYLATDLTEVPRRPDGIEESAIEVVRLALDDALSMLDDAAPFDSTLALALRTFAARRAH